MKDNYIEKYKYNSCYPTNSSENELQKYNKEYFAQRLKQGSSEENHLSGNSSCADLPNVENVSSSHVAKIMCERQKLAPISLIRK